MVGQPMKDIQTEGETTDWEDKVTVSDITEEHPTSGGGGEEEGEGEGGREPKGGAAAGDKGKGGEDGARKSEKGAPEIETKQVCTNMIVLRSYCMEGLL